jgi:hypothetical protein
MSSTKTQPEDNLRQVESNGHIGHYWFCDECNSRPNIIFDTAVSAAYDYGIHVGLYHT